MFTVKDVCCAVTVTVYEDSDCVCTFSVWRPRVRPPRARSGGVEAAREASSLHEGAASHQDGQRTNILQQEAEQVRQGG